MEKVEKLFWEIQSGKKLNREIIEKFIKASSKYKTVSRYYNGICQYLYGVLAKERSEESGLNYSEYEKKFESALSDLKFYRNNLSNIIRGLIFFNFNKFIDANTLCPNLRLGFAANNLSDACIWKSNFIHTEDSILTDRINEQLIHLSTLSIKEFGNWLPYILALIKDKDISQIDHIKIAILLAKYFYINEDIENCKKHIRYLNNFSEFGYITKSLSLPDVRGNCNDCE